MKNLLLSFSLILLTTNLSQASPADSPGLRSLAGATTGNYHAPAEAPAGGVIVAPGTITSVLMQSTSASDNVKLRVTSGALKGSIVDGSFTGKPGLLIEITNIQTPYGTEVWMPVCKVQDRQGELDLQRVQVVASEWQQVRKGGVAAAGTQFHIRLLAQVQFDVPAHPSTEYAMARN